MLEHGGRLQRAIDHYGIPREDWLDLSSGIAPWPFAIPEIPLSAWTRLPEIEDGLEQAARRYYGVDEILSVAGSQAAIQALPHLRAPGRIGVLSPCYAEHPHAWLQAGHTLVELSEAQVESQLDSLDVLVLVNPNNPTGLRLPPERLRRWHARLARRGAWLVVDEAFMDNSPADSVLQPVAQPGLIVLRSFGKFFGLAGVRLGFVIAEASLLQRLADHLGPWAVSGPTRVLGTACLLSVEQQQRQLAACASQSARLGDVLDAAGLGSSGRCDLFHYLTMPHAARFYEHLARRGILVRLFASPPAVRLGLPADDAGLQRLAAALADYDKDLA